MKALLIGLCVFVQAASAVIEMDGDISAPPPAPPHYRERFQYQTTLLLDRRTFGSQELTRLDLDNLLKRSASFNRLKMAYDMSTTREGVIIIIVVEGEAKEMLWFFDSLLNHNVISMVYNLGGFPWSLPSEEYKKYWGDIYRGIQREIETRAMMKWAAQQSSLSASDLCSRLVEINRLHAPVSMPPKPRPVGGIGE